MSNNTPGSPEGHHHPAIRFTIDGREFSTLEPWQTASSLLKLAGLDPSGYDLAQFLGHGQETKRFADSDEVHVHEGASFISIRESATVA